MNKLLCDHEIRYIRPFTGDFGRIPDHLYVRERGVIVYTELANPELVIEPESQTEKPTGFIKLQYPLK